MQPLHSRFMYLLQHGQCSWMEMHQFLGDLITSGIPSKNPPDVLNAAWGVAAGVGGSSGGNGAADAALGFKATSLEPLRPAQEKTGAGSSQRTRDRREALDVHHACTCPGCPYSSSPPSFETLVPRQSLSLPPHSETVCQPKDLSIAIPVSLSMCLPDSTLPSSSTISELQTSRPQSEDVDRGTQSQDQNSDSPPARPSLSHLSMFPHLCCHHGLQTCSCTLGRQDGTDSPFSHTHAHHHFHHHHCPLTSCLPCPQLAHANSPRLSGPFPCLSCPHSFHACSQVCHHHHRQTQQQEERGRTSTTLLSALHPCMHCSASFSRPSQLLQHQRSEHAHKPSGFICTECGRAFNSHSNLRIHLNVHTGARPYSCADCGKSFSQSGALKIHRRIHTGERPYSCGFCGRGFPHLAGVRAHQRTHTGEKPYRCTQCGKCFTQSGALKIHTRIHTGERPFICSICGKGFSNRSGIRFHYRTVHGLAPELTGETRSVYRGPAARACQPGRPRTLPPTSAGLDAPHSPGNESHAGPSSRDSSALIAAPPASTPTGGNECRSQPEAANVGSHREGLPYACEDCGLRFKDAPSRNRHQSVVHYSHEGREEEGQRKEFSSNDDSEGE
ncbi:zinc finger protein 835 isoform X1 [Archocentrus centrarchus]|uniref:zinc finger protein 835 isoform X1 n=1 Tax=Archocentrus centrarchus TaxID=63155 RepID=UPI0011EA4C58|nr:zinc finger protein 835-like isoform X1 [Archocentrus centrarchus]